MKRFLGPCVAGKLGVLRTPRRRGPVLMVTCGHAGVGEGDWGLWLENRTKWTFLTSAAA